MNYKPLPPAELVYSALDTNADPRKIYTDDMAELKPWTEIDSRRDEIMDAWLAFKAEPRTEAHTTEWLLTELREAQQQIIAARDEAIATPPTVQIVATPAPATKLPTKHAAPVQMSREDMAAALRAAGFEVKAPPKREQNANVQKAKAYQLGEPCPFCLAKGLTHEPDKLIPHPSKPDAMRQHFAGCTHSVNLYKDAE